MQYRMSFFAYLTNGEEGDGIIGSWARTWRSSSNHNQRMFQYNQVIKTASWDLLLFFFFFFSFLFPFRSVKYVVRVLLPMACNFAPASLRNRSQECICSLI